MEEGSAFQKSGIPRQGMLPGNLLHFFQGQAFCAVMQKPGFLRPERSNPVHLRQMPGCPGYGKGMGETMRIQRLEETVQPFIRPGNAFFLMIQAFVRA